MSGKRYPEEFKIEAVKQVVDLFSRKIIGWSMQSRMTKDIVLNALLMAVWRRNPQKQVLVHSDQGSQ